MSDVFGAPIDPLDGPALALGGRVVTMDDSKHVVDDGVVYVQGGTIAAVQKAGHAPPAGFEHVAVADTKGTIYPGLIDLHDHLSYNALQLWDVPKRYTNRDQWAQGDTYRKLVTGPMKVLAHTPKYVPAVVRYVECKCLVGGTTTSQGIALSSFAGIQRFYKGIVRNVEQTDEDDLPEAATHIADVEAKDREKFLKRLKSLDCLLLHLSEGTDDKAREHFLALQGPDDEWAITSALAGIHCVALQKKDFEVLHEGGGSMVWSPLSNLLLYGETADVAQAKAAGITIALGPDWSPSGSKNLLGELKLARLVDGLDGASFSDYELISLATRNPAKILRWDKALGTLEAGKRADLLVVSGTTGDAHAHLFTRSEHDVELVVVNGVPRYGASRLMRKVLGEAADAGEAGSAGGRARLFYLVQATGDPAVGKLTLKEATDLLATALQRLPELAKDMVEHPTLDPEATILVLDHEEQDGVDQRPHLPGPDGEPTAEVDGTLRATPLPDLLVPLTLDPLTAVDDDRFVKTLAKEQNLPKEVADHVPDLF
ncbi:MAG TPA: amidohydrolase family protein [Gaiellaceae bacterium]